VKHNTFEVDRKGLAGFSGENAIEHLPGCDRMVLSRPAPIPVLDLFAGCGGMSLGLEQAGGFEIVAACEWDPQYPAIAETYRRKHPKTRLVEGDITKEETKRAIAHSFLRRRCEVVAGGPPCVCDSTSGRRRADDPRGLLHEDYLDIVQRLKPDVAVMERVLGSLHRRKGEDVPVTERIVGELGRLGYRVEHRVLNAADYGVPQARRRVIVIAAKLGIPVIFPPPTHSEHASLFNDETPWITVGDAMDDFLGLPEDPERWHVFAKHGVPFATKIARTPCGESACPGKFGDAFVRNHSDRPARTVRTNGAVVHHGYHRTLTPRELARLQSFPDSFDFVGTVTAVRRMIGNAVPPRLAKAVALSVREMLRGVVR
jgi:DNA (cytosine-5)-methyltransferase 1